MASKMKPHKETLWNLIIFLVSMSAIFQVTISMETPILSIYLLHLTGDLRHVGSVLAAYTFSSAMFAMLASRYLLRYRFKLIHINYGGAVIYCLIMYSHPSLYEVYATQIFGGIIAGIGYAGFMNIFVFSVDQNDYTKVYSFNKFLSFAIGSLAAAGSGFIAHYMGIENVFLAMASISAVSVIISISAEFYDKKHRHHEM